MRILWSTVVVLLVDQLTKIIVLQTMYRGQSIPLLGDWLKLTFTENPGMAFGITFGPKGLVTVLSIIATGLIMYYMYRVRDGYLPYRVSLAVILGGALGNIIDRVFYGFLFGYGPLFGGKVVDFIHVDIWRGFIPDVLPVIGGSYTALFPIWNVADMAIVCGVVGILFFQKHFHEELEARIRASSEAAPAEGPQGTASRPFAPPAFAPTDVPPNGRDAVGEAGKPNKAGGTPSGSGAPTLPVKRGTDPADTPQTSDEGNQAGTTGSAESQRPE